MDREDTHVGMTPNFPYGIEDDIGEILMSEEQCPGVFYVATKWEGALFATEFYIVNKNADTISDAAKRYGKPLPHHPEILAYRMDEERSGSVVIKYEAERYRLSNRLSPIDDDNLHTVAVYGAEDYPDYFGEYPAPTMTPRGAMLRYKALANGVFIIETDECEKVLAVCYPIWHSNFSYYVMRRSEQTEYDKKHGIDNTLGYLFFPYEAVCLAIFEMLKDKPEILTSGLVDAAALHNAIWESYPDYAVEYNKAEQAGMHDVMGMLLNVVGVDIEPSGSIEEMMKITLDAGTDYLKTDR